MGPLSQGYGIIIALTSVDKKLMCVSSLGCYNELSVDPPKVKKCRIVLMPECAVLVRRLLVSG